MKYLTVALFFAASALTFDSNAQSKTEKGNAENSFTITIDSLEIDIRNNYESDIPPINLNKLKEPTLFILDNKELRISKFSELQIDDKKFQSVTIIQNPKEIKNLGYNDFNSVVKINTIEEKE